MRGFYPPYEILEHLQEPSEYDVCQGRDLRSGCEVALRCLPLADAVSISELRHCVGNAKTLLKAGHRNVLVAEEVVVTDGNTYFVTEQSFPVTLASQISEVGLSLARALYLAYQVASALAAAHDVGMIHGGLHPQLVLMEGDRVLVFGFGFSPFLRDTYMSPEQMRGKPPDGRSDVYLWGILLGAMLNGEQPGSEGVGPFALRLAAGDLRLRDSPGPDVVQALHGLLQQAVAPDPGDRHQSMSDLSAEVAGLLARLSSEEVTAPVGVLDVTTTMSSLDVDKLSPTKERLSADVARTVNLRLQKAQTEVIELSGQLIDDRYRLISSLGRGGMGEVYKAIDRLTEEAIALKMVTTEVHQLDIPHRRPRGGDPSRQASADLRLALVREFETLSSLRHPNIIGVMDHGFYGGDQPYYTMELLERPEGVLDVARKQSLAGKIEILVQILRALSYLHRRGIIHRDLKPANVLFQDQAKVVDFGLATKSGQLAEGLAGTLAYIAPEILRGSSPTEGSDLFAVGVMAYEMIAGSYPFRRQQLMEEILECHPDFAALGVGEGLNAVIRRLLEKDPQERWQRAHDVIEALADAAGLNLPYETRETRESFLQAATFVNRIEEMAALVPALDRAAQGHGSLWLLAGESGIGKSRLLTEVRTNALVQGMRVISGVAAREHKGEYHILQEALRGLALCTPLSDEELSKLQVLIPNVGRLLGRRVPTAELNPKTVKLEMLALVRSIFQRQSRPLLVVLEDLHWSQGSLEILQGLADEIPRLPIMVVGSYRQEEAPKLSEQLPAAEVIPVGPLHVKDIAQLTESMLGNVDGTQEVAEYLDHHTEGNVFFIVETVRTLAEEAGGLGRVGGMSLPEQILAKGVQDVIKRRLDRVPEAQRPLLETAAVMGRELDRTVLEKILGREAVEQGLEVCNNLALLVVQDNRWQFAHDNFRTGVVVDLETQQRQRLHREIGLAIEELHAEDEEQATLLTYHFRRAGDLEKEAKYSSLAGHVAMRKGAYRDAASFLQRALTLREAQEDRDVEAEIEILLQIGWALIATQGWTSPEVKQTYDRAIELGKELGSQKQVAPALHGLSVFFFIQGKLWTSLDLARTCLDLAEESGDPILRQHARMMVGESRVWLGEMAQDLDYVQEIAESYHPKQLPVHLSLYGMDPRISSLAASTCGTWMLGYPEKALQMSRDATRIAEETQHPFSIASAQQIAAWLHQLRGDVNECLAGARTLAARSAEHELFSFTVLAGGLEGWCLARQGETEKGLLLLQEAMQQWHMSGARLVSDFLTTLFADACLAAGNFDEGLTKIDHVLSGALDTDAACYQAELYRLRGELLLRLGDAAGAEQAFDQALRVAREQRAKSFELRAVVSLARFLRQRGMYGKAREYLQAICSWFGAGESSPDLENARPLLEELNELET